MRWTQLLKNSILFILIINYVAIVNLYANEIKVCKDISAPEVKHMLMHDNALVVHVMSSFEYDIQHIEKSINIPINKIMEQQDKLPKDKSFPIIFYCMGKR